MVTYGDDGLTWDWYLPEQQRGRPQINGVRKMTDPPSAHLLQPTIVARFIRIHPQKWKKQIAMRVQMSGCTSKSARNTH